MWNPSQNTVYADPDDFVKEPLTKPKPTTFQKIKQWVRERPVVSALIGLLVVGGIVAVIVGPVVSSQKENSDSKQAPETIAQSSEFKLTFEASNASNLCASLADASKLSDYSAAVRSSVAGVLGVAGSQVVVRSVQCGSQTYELPVQGDSANRRLLRRRLSVESDPSLSLVVLFRLNANPPRSSSSSSVADPAAVAAALQSDRGKAALVQAISKALGVPESSIIFISVVTAPASPAAGPLSPPLVQPSSSQKSPPPPPVSPIYGGSSPGYGSGAIPPSYGAPGPYGGDHSPPPVY